MRIDLHMHSTASDGILSPEELLAFCRKNGILIAAICDHDSVEGASKAASSQNPRILPAVELSADSRETHILGYGINTAHSALQSALALLKQSRILRNPKIIRKLQELGINITEQEVARHSGNGSIGRPHIARVLVEKGYVRSVKEAFERYLSHHKAAYVSREKLSTERCIRLIREAGGLPVLAHPSTLGLSFDALEATAAQLQAQGLWGLEVFYPGQIAHQSAYLSICKNLGLLPTGGSDYHGGEELFPVDTVQYPALEQTLAVLLHSSIK
ncbi:MAG: hypothetical protein ACOYI4_07715 [Christensenellales bacterium]